MTAATTLLVNPAAGLGRAADRVARAYAALRTIGPVVVVETQRAGDERRLAREAAQAGTRALVVLGGDGAVSQAARGLLDLGASVPLAVFPAGTGNDFAKSLGFHAPDYLRIARALADGSRHCIDAGTMDGVPFVNAAGVGFDVDVLLQMQQPARWLRGPLRYVGTALGQLARARGHVVAVSALRDAVPHPWLTVVFANGQWFGGTFRIAPQAQLANGMLDCIGISTVPLGARAHLLARALRGAHLGQPGTWTAREARYALTFDEPPLFQADGELYRARERTLEVRTLPGALTVVRAPSPGTGDPVRERPAPLS